jgi:hypothetical protein
MELLLTQQKYGTFINTTEVYRKEQGLGNSLGYMRMTFETYLSKVYKVWGANGTSFRCF